MEEDSEMGERVYNFYPGPATLPYEVLEEASQSFLDFNHKGMSLLEMSHRGKDYEAIQNETESLMKELLDMPDHYRVLFMGGGASTQFALVPMNFLKPGTEADYIVTGSFAKKAYEEAAKIGKANIAASTKGSNFDRLPAKEEIKLSASPVYVHLTSNNTIYGTQWQELPSFGGVPLVADMSSDIMSRRFDVSQFSLIYAGAQKNLGPAGVTVVIIDPGLLEKANTDLPVIMQYKTFVENDSLYNTPPVYAIYMVNLVLKWIKKNGGLAAMERRNQEKAKYIYDVLDQYPEFYKGHAQKEYRSLMNVTFRLPSEELEATFVAEGAKNGLVGLKGHRSVGGIRASIYNAMPVEGCKALAEFMKEFVKKNG